MTKRRKPIRNSVRVAINVPPGFARELKEASDVSGMAAAVLVREAALRGWSSHKPEILADLMGEEEER